MPIAVGKLSLYVAGAGWVYTVLYISMTTRLISFSFRPSSTLPITLDLGTNNASNLSDPLYLGLRQRRSSEVEYDAFMDEFITEMGRVYPKVLVQFEVRSYYSLFLFRYMNSFTGDRISRAIVHSPTLIASVTVSRFSTTTFKVLVLLSLQGFSPLRDWFLSRATSIESCS